MGSDKSFDTLLNKYNILLAQTRDLKEHYSKSSKYYIRLQRLFRQMTFAFWIRGLNMMKTPRKIQKNAICNICVMRWKL